MSAVRHLVAELEEKGLRVAWGDGGPSLSGDLGKLTSAHLAELRAHRKELEALTLWRQLQDENEARFGHPAARLYPFVGERSWEFWKAPLIRTSAGAAHLVQVLSHAARVVKASEVRQWQEDQGLQHKTFPFPGKTLLLPLADVWPPKAPPPISALETDSGRAKEQTKKWKGESETA